MYIYSGLIISRLCGDTGDNVTINTALSLEAATAYKDQRRTRNSSHDVSDDAMNKLYSKIRWKHERERGQLHVGILERLHRKAHLCGEVIKQRRTGCRFQIEAG